MLQNVKPGNKLQKRRFSRLFHTAVLGVLAACHGSNHPPASAASPLRVALLTPGPVSDQSWNAGAYQGLLAIRDSLGAQISHIQTTTPADFEDNFRQYASQGYQLVFGHGFEFQDAARRVAPDYPRTDFVTTSGNTAGPNLAGLEFNLDDPSYLAGMIAGAMTHTGVVGMIGGTELPPVRQSFAAFAQGVRRLNPRARVISSYIGNWDDVSAGREQALAQIAHGADVIFQNADAAGLGVFQAAKQSRHVYVLGSNSNQNDVAPEVTLGSVVINLPHALLTVAREVKDGTFRGRVISLGMNDDVVTLVLNPAIISRIPIAARTAVDSVRAQMQRGTFSVADTGRSPVR